MKTDIYLNRDLLADLTFSVILRAMLSQLCYGKVDVIYQFHPQAAL